MEWLSLGLNLASAFGSYQADKAAAKAAQAWQAYSNTMLRLSDGLNQNAITTNEILSQQAFADQAIGIKQSNILTQAQAEVSAAAAGVKGTSVDDVMRDINRSAAVAENKRQNDLNASYLAFDQQRQSSAMSAAMQQDYSYIPKPKLGSYLLKAAAASLGGGGGTSAPAKYNPPTSSGGETQSVSVDWSSPKSFFDTGTGWLVNNFFNK
jgi:hypothetical protein